MTLLFGFEYTSCFRETLVNEAAVVTLFSLPEHMMHNKSSNAGCFGEKDGATRYLRTRVPISRELNNAMTVFSFKVCNPFLLSLFTTTNEYHMAGPHNKLNLKLFFALKC